jgi:hypothetical protein
MGDMIRGTQVLFRRHSRVLINEFSDPTAESERTLGERTYLPQM